MNAKVLSRSVSPSGAVQYLVHVPELYCGQEYIVASAVEVMFSGPETYLFAAERSGRITDWVELPGSQRGTLNVGEVLIEAGIHVTEFDGSLLN